MIILLAHGQSTSAVTHTKCLSYVIFIHRCIYRDNCLKCAVLLIFNVPVSTMHNLCSISGGLLIVKIESAYMYDVNCHIHIIKCYFRLWSNALYFNFSKNSYVYQYYTENLSYLKKERDYRDLERETRQNVGVRKGEREKSCHIDSISFFNLCHNRHCANDFCYIFVYFI